MSDIKVLNFAGCVWSLVFVFCMLHYSATSNNRSMFLLALSWYFYLTSYVCIKFRNQFKEVILWSLFYNIWGWKVFNGVVCTFSKRILNYNYGFRVAIEFCDNNSFVHWFDICKYIVCFVPRVAFLLFR